MRLKQVDNRFKDDQINKTTMDLYICNFGLTGDSSKPILHSKIEMYLEMFGLNIHYSLTSKYPLPSYRNSLLKKSVLFQH